MTIQSHFSAVLMWEKVKYTKKELVAMGEFDE